MVRLTVGHIEAVESLVVDPGLSVLGPAVGGKAKQAKAELVRDAGSFADQMVHLHNFVAGHRLFVGWNVANDRKNLANELLLASASFGEMTWVDGVDLIRLATGWRGGYKPGLEQAWLEIFGGPWRQQHAALVDALHTAHLVRALSRRLVGSGYRPEHIPTAAGWLGTAWRPVQAISAPKRRFPLPPPPPEPPVGRRWLDQWRAEQGLPPRQPNPDPCPRFSAPSGADHRGAGWAWRQRYEKKWTDSGLSVRYTMPVPVEEHDLAAQVEAYQSAARPIRDGAPGEGATRTA
jgi:hypothetical protein